MMMQLIWPKDLMKTIYVIYEHYVLFSSTVGWQSYFIFKSLCEYVVNVIKVKPVSFPLVPLGI